jgi:hypothetical protein
MRLAFVILLAAAGVDASGLAMADDPDGGASSQAAGNSSTQGDVSPMETEYRSPFEPYPDGPGDIRFEELSPDEQEAVMRLGEAVETQQGYEVHQAWSRYSHSKAAEAKVRRAAYASGAAGLDTVGVE